MKKTREIVQKNGIELASKYNKLVLEWCTSLGKSYGTIQIIEKLSGNWNIVIAETNHKLNWIEEFKKHGKSKLLKKVKFFCYHSLGKYLDDENYIFDEVHHIFSDKRMELLSKINIKYFIGLSATLTWKQKEKLKEVIGEFHVDKVSLNDAIDWGILPEPTVYFIGIELDNIKKYCKFHFNKDKYILCTEQEMYNRMSDRVDWLKGRYFDTRKEIHKILWLNYANQRKKFLVECKTKSIQYLLNTLKNKRFICFAGNIKQAELLANNNCIHSKLHIKKREKIIEDFNNGDLDQLFAVGMLREGVNLANIEVGIIVQLDNVERMFNQIHGRTLRSKYPEQYVLYIKNTQDEVYVNTAIENFDKKYVKFININEL